MPAAVTVLRVRGERQSRDDENEKGGRSHRRSYPLHAQPGGWVHVSVFAMQELPHAFPVVHTLQHGPDEFLHAVARGGPLAAASVSASVLTTRTFLQIHRTPFMGPPFAEGCTRV